MNIFFGKISKKFDTLQLTEGYYSAPQDSPWFGELQPKDYVFMIGGDRIQFWQAREWGEKNDNYCMFFDILESDLGISVSQFIMLKFFIINKALAVLTSRSTRNKAFFKLDFIYEVSVSDLSSAQYYTNPELYRTIKIIKKENVITDSNDIQLVYENGQLELVTNRFVDPVIQKQFFDNLINKGKGSRMKDNILEFFSKAVENLPSTIAYNEIGFRSFYDTFFCKYTGKDKYFLVGAYWDSYDPQDQTDRFLKEGIWENGYDDKFTTDVNAVQAGSFIAIKTAFVREKFKAVMSIKARGEVLENPQDGKTLIVDWDEDLIPFEVSFGGYMNTIKEVTNQSHIKAIWSPNLKDIETDNSVLANHDFNPKFPLNQILYGPPGTGKTYSTIIKTIAIVDGISEEEVQKKYPIRKDLKKYYNDLFIDIEKKTGQIAFTTFHQSLSYEDFVEGIKPKVEGISVTYSVKSGIFQQMAEMAKNNWLDAKKGSSADLSFDDAFFKLKEEIEEFPETKFSMKTKDKDFRIIGFTEKSIQFQKASGSINHTLSINTLRDYYFGNREVRQTGVGIYYPSVLEKLNSYQGSIVNKIRRNYVLVIDEINRGNVSAIFGELITLLETDKRLGSDEFLEVILPYSQDKFSIPPNLYIIGTMNTADRSVEALDTALRRRFSFEEMLPKPELLSPSAMFCRLLWEYEDVKWDVEPYKSKEIDLFKLINPSVDLLAEKENIWMKMKANRDRYDLTYFDKFTFSGINLENLLETINLRIEKLIDKDHKLGHSYFLKVQSYDSLQYAFEKEIIPLLQEYFFGDNGKIGLVLGSSFISKASNSNSQFSFAKFTEYDQDVQSDLKEKSIYTIRDKSEWNFADILI